MNIETDSGIISRESRQCGYVVQVAGRYFDPAGIVPGITQEQCDAHNTAVDKLTLYLLDNAAIGSRGTLYLRGESVTTWLGKLVAQANVSGSPTSRHVTFYRRVGGVTGSVATFRGRLRADSDCFNWRRVA